MITIVKLDPSGAEKIRYTGKVISRSQYEVVVQASWTMEERDLGYTRFKPGDRFVEFYYANRWFNIFDIAQEDGPRKGWYCNVTEPAHITETSIEQVDLLLDVWVDPTGKILILDEDEFAATTTLSETQRLHAQQGLQALLDMIEKRQEVFSSLAEFS